MASPVKVMPPEELDADGARRRLPHALTSTLSSKLAELPQGYREGKPVDWEMDDAHLASIFDLTDKDKNGSLSKNEFVSVVRAMRIDMKESKEHEDKEHLKAQKADSRTKKVMIVSAIGFAIFTLLICVQTVAMFLVVDNQVRPISTQALRRQRAALCPRCQLHCRRCCGPVNRRATSRPRTRSPPVSSGSDERRRRRARQQALWSGDADGAGPLLHLSLRLARL
jgi:hypothetical protein